jgi:hypothetical protein
VSANVAITATFTLKQYNLQVTVNGSGDGTVTSSPTGIDCGTDCGQLYDHGTTVTLTAAATTGSTFTGWSGGGCTGTAPCDVQMTQARNVTATFAINVYDLEITKAGLGVGTVTSVPSGINCGSTCSASYTHGTSVTITATPDAFSTFTSWSGGGCTGTAPCTVSMTQARSVTATFARIPPNVMFVTSTQQTAAFGPNGIADADALCLARAQAGGLVGTGAGRNMTWRAWLSSSTASATSRIGSARGWARPDGRPVLDQIGDIGAHRFIYPPRIDENGNDVGPTKFVFTATTGAGAFDDADTSPGVCRPVTGGLPDYGGTLGNINQGFASGNSAMFTTLNDNLIAPPLQCSAQARIYCMGIDRTALVTATPTPIARLAFTSTASWNPGANPGIAAADQICKNEAMAAGLGTNFLALLAGDGFSAISRFALTTPWVRMSDRVPIVPAAAILNTVALQIVDVVPNATTTGVRLGDVPIWTGARDPASPGGISSTCQNWATGGGAGQGGRAGDTSMAVWFAMDPSAPCDVPRRVVCLEQ